MDKSVIRIGLIFATDYQGYPPGGCQPTIEIFLKGARDRSFDITLFGVTTDGNEAVGQVSQRRIYGREYPFVPLFYLDAARYANRKPLVPVRVQTVLAYLRHRRQIDAMKFDLLYLHGVETLPFLWPKRQPVLYHFHGPEETAAQYSRYSIFQSPAFVYLYGKAIQSILERADQFIAIDPETYDRYTQRVPHRKERFHLFPTAIDVDQFRPLDGFDRRAARLRFGLPPEGKMVLYVGRLSWRKGVDLLFRAFSLVAAQVPDAFLAIAGMGEDRRALESLAHELKLDGRVFFLGKVAHLPSPDLPSLFNAADVSVVTSLQESLALVITEALACGTPVISTPVGIAPKVIRDGVTGYMVQSREPSEMAMRLVQIIQDGKYDRAECVAAAQEYGETSKPICDVIEQLCWGNGERSGTVESTRFEGQAALK
jgi:glycosyltransferase involved in cell wall biosynthesis